MSEELVVVWYKGQAAIFGSSTYKNRVVVSRLSSTISVRGHAFYAESALMVVPNPELKELTRNGLGLVNDGRSEFNELFPPALTKQGWMVMFSGETDFYYADRKMIGKVHTFNQPGFLVLDPSGPMHEGLSVTLMTYISTLGDKLSLEEILEKAKADGVVVYDFLMATETF